MSVTALCIPAAHANLTITACSIHWSHTEPAAGVIVVLGCKDFNIPTVEHSNSLWMAAEFNLHVKCEAPIAGLTVEQRHVRCNVRYQ